MIDIEREIISEVMSKLLEKFPGTYVTGELVKSPPTFPCVFLTEMDNSVLERTQSSSCMENHATVMYEANIYSNRTTGKKSECRDLAIALDSIMANMGFTRIMMNPITNLNDTAIYRITARYRAVVSTDKTIYRR